MKDKIHFWVTSLYGEDEKHPRYKLFEENHKRVPSLELKPSIDGRDPFKVIEKWIDLNVLIYIFLFPSKLTQEKFSL